MKKYRILKPLILGFTTPQDQYDAIIGPEDGIILESNEQTIWAVKNGKRQESITMVHIIACWLEAGIIAEIQGGCQK